MANPGQKLCSRLILVYLDMEAIIVLITIHAQFLVALEPDPVGTGGLPAAVADKRRKDPGVFRYLEGGFLY